MSRAGGPNNVGNVNISITGDTADFDRKLAETKAKAAQAASGTASGADDPVEKVRQELFGTEKALKGVDEQASQTEETMGQLGATVSTGYGQWLLYGGSVIATATAFYKIGEAIGNAVFRVHEYNEAIKFYEQKSSEQGAFASTEGEKRIAAATKGTVSEGSLKGLAAKRAQLQDEILKIDQDITTTKEMLTNIGGSGIDISSAAFMFESPYHQITRAQTRKDKQRQLDEINSQLAPEKMDRILGQNAQQRAFDLGLPTTGLRQSDFPGQGERASRTFGGDAAAIERIFLEQKALLGDINNGIRQLNANSINGNKNTDQR